MKLITILMVLLLLLLQYRLWTGNGSLVEVSLLKDEIEKIKSENQRLKERNLSLTAEVFNLKAGILIRQGRLEEAKINIEKALAQNPTLFPAKFNLAATESRLGNVYKSNLLVEELLALSPQHNETLMLKAFNLSKAGNLEEAKQIYLDILTLTPSNTGARERVSSLYQQQGDTKNALYHLDLLIKDDFDNADYLLRKAALQLEAGQRADAEKTLSIVRNFINDDAGKLIAYADQARSVDNNENALDAMARAYEIANTSTFVTLRYVSQLLDKQNNDKAQSLLTTIPANQQKNPVYYFLKGRLAANKGNSERAIREFEKTLDVDATFAQAFVAIYNYALTVSYTHLTLPTNREV